MTGVATLLINSLQNRRKSNGHNIVGIQGEPGVGKSTLGIGIARNLEPTFDPANIYYERGNCWEEIGPAPKGSIFILDEGTNVAMNRTWQDREQVGLVQLLNTIRQRNHTLIWCAPNLDRLDIVVREDLITHKLNCIRRGIARVRTKRLDRDGEPSGWKTWPGYLAWPSLDNHPIWGPYYHGKEASYKQRVQNKGRKPAVAGSEIEELKARLAAPQAGDVLV